MKKVYFLTTLYKSEGKDNWRVLGQKKTANIDDAYDALTKLLNRIGIIKDLEGSIIKVVFEDDHLPRVEVLLDFDNFVIIED